LELLASRKSEFLERHNCGLYDRVSLSDEKALLTSRSTRRIIAVSQLVRSQIENFYGVRQEHIAVVPNGVDITMFDQLRSKVDRPALRSSVGCSQDDFLVLFVGNEFGRKGLRVVIRSVRALSDRRVRLLVVGAGDRERYSQFAVELGVGGNVLFLGGVPGPEDLYCAADAFVLPSLYEPFGIVVLEAMAAGVPVITSKMCGATERMNHNQVLHLEDPTSVDEVTAALRLLKRDEHLRRTLIEEGGKAVREFAWNRIAQKVLNVYHEVKGSQ
jgi:UDP-glucose:(heptosyl)LPS alpha-1,3-glucosyltransferase